MKVGIIGFIPPPYGGISIHTSRLFSYARDKINVRLYNEDKSIVNEENVINTGGYKKYFLQYFFTNEDIYHYHSPNKKMRMLMGLIPIITKKKTIITLHGEGIFDEIEGCNYFVKFIYKYLLNKITFIIADNEKLKNYMLGIGIKSENISVIEAFIPPTIKNEDIKHIPEYIKKFYNDHDYILYSMAWVTFHDGIDLYGIDMLIELMKAIKYDFSENIGLVIKILGCEEKYNDYYKILKRRIIDYKLQNNILIIEEKLPEIYPLEKDADLMLRPSCTDGDSVSIRESLYFRVPVITSDAIPRPEGCILFKNRDMEDFIGKVEKCLIMKINREEFNIPEQINSAEKIVNLYKKIYKS